MWRGQHNGHWDISRRLLEKEVFWPWSRSPGAPGAGFWRKRRGPSRSSSSSIPFICLQSVSNPRTGGCTWESDLDYILSRSYRWTLDQRKSYCLELITSLLFSWAVKMYHILPPKIAGSLRLRKTAPRVQLLFFRGKTMNIPKLKIPETTFLYHIPLRHATYFWILQVFYFASQACGIFEPEHKERNTNIGLTKLDKAKSFKQIHRNWLESGLRIISWISGLNFKIIADILKILNW